MASFKRELPISTKVRRLPGMMSAPPIQKPTRRKVPDLTGTPVWWLIGPNASGKTLVARWLIERATLAGRSVKGAALDVNARTLVEYFPDGIDQPDKADPDYVMKWMAGYLAHVAEMKVPAVFDMGGGDQALALMIQTNSELLDILAGQHQAAVAAYFLSPRDKDLDSLATFEAVGFQPKNTVLVLNEALTTDPDLFTPIVEHEVVKAAVARGAVLLRLPRLFDQETAIRMEAGNLLFGEGGSGLLQSGEAAPLDSFQQYAVRRAQALLDDTFAPIVGWLP
jgi:hypothetical protein